MSELLPPPHYILMADCIYYEQVLCKFSTIQPSKLHFVIITNFNVFQIGFYVVHLHKVLHTSGMKINLQILNKCLNVFVFVSLYSDTPD